MRFRAGASYAITQDANVIIVLVGVRGCVMNADICQKTANQQRFHLKAFQQYV